MRRVLRLPIALFSLLAAANILPLGAAAAPRIVKINATDAMQYSVKRIEARPGETLKIALTAVGTMPKSEMAHNWVLLAPGTDVAGFVMAAGMARRTDHIPAAKKSQILAHTALAGAGETVEVVFEAPKEPGEYVFLCTFPAHHAGGMRGLLVVKG